MPIHDSQLAIKNYKIAFFLRLGVSILKVYQTGDR